jgi:hypothetical protein
MEAARMTDTDRDAAPAAAEGADDPEGALIDLLIDFTFDMVEVGVKFPEGSLYTLRKSILAWHAARPAPAAAPREGGIPATVTCSGGRLEATVLPGAASRAAEGAELERLRIEHAAAVRAVDAGRRLDEPHDSCEEGPGLADAMMTAYEVWRCVVSGIEIPAEKMAVLMAAAREAARGEGEAR